MGANTRQQKAQAKRAKTVAKECSKSRYGLRIREIEIISLGDAVDDL